MTRRPPAVVVLNPAARHGTAEARYELVRPTLQAAFHADEVRTDKDGSWIPRVHGALEQGVRIFVAAGGDGTVHALVNALDGGTVSLDQIVLGGVGLGSSNDFFKPVCQTIDGIPLRIDAQASEFRDLVRVHWEDDVGESHERVCTVSSSVGVTAAANGFFNRGDALLRALKGRWTGAAIAWAAVRTIATWQNLSATLGLAGTNLAVSVANLSVLETPYLSGSFRYNTPVNDHDGHMVVNLIEGRGRIGLLVMLGSLAMGRFLGRPGTRSWTVDHMELALEETADLEFDGEVVAARRASFDVMPRRIQLCG